MAWEEKKGSGSGKNIVKWETPGQELTGVYLGTVTNKDKNGKEFSNIKVRQEGNLGDAEASYTTDLADKLADVEPGTTVKIVYAGLVPTNSGRRVKKFRVLVAS